MLTKQMRELERQHEVVTYKNSTEDIKPQVEAFVAKVNTELKAMYSQRYEGVTAPTIEIQWCTKLARLVTGKVTGNSVWGFIALKPGVIGGVSYTTGDLMKAASWRGPAKHSRGNILDNTAAYGMYGPTYLKK